MRRRGPIHRRTAPELVLEALRAAPGPLTSNALGEALDVCDGRRWTHPGYQLTMLALGRLRDEGLACKLPHEGVRAGATYAACVDHEQASRMQLEATEALLAGLRDEQRGSLRERLLVQALVGLRGMVKGDTERTAGGTP